MSQPQVYLDFTDSCESYKLFPHHSDFILIYLLYDRWYEARTALFSSWPSAELYNWPCACFSLLQLQSKRHLLKPQLGGFNLKLRSLPVSRTKGHSSSAQSGELGKLQGLQPGRTGWLSLTRLRFCI